MKIGVDLGGTRMGVILLDRTNNELFRKRVTTPKDDYHQTVNLIVRLVSDAEAYTGQQGTVGVGIPGTISPVSDSVKNANSTWING